MCFFGVEELLIYHSGGGCFSWPTLILFLFITAAHFVSEEVSNFKSFSNTWRKGRGRRELSTNYYIPGTFHSSDGKPMRSVIVLCPFYR